jgi:hypothetical protein
MSSLDGIAKKRQLFEKIYAIQSTQRQDILLKIVLSLHLERQYRFILLKKGLTP